MDCWYSAIHILDDILRFTFAWIERHTQYSYSHLLNLNTSPAYALLIVDDVAISTLRGQTSSSPISSIVRNLSSARALVLTKFALSIVMEKRLVFGSYTIWKSSFRSSRYAPFGSVPEGSFVKSRTETPRIVNRAGSGLGDGDSVGVTVERGTIAGVGETGRATGPTDGFFDNRTTASTTPRNNITPPPARSAMTCRDMPV